MNMRRRRRAGRRRAQADPGGRSVSEGERDHARFICPLAATAASARESWTLSGPQHPREQTTTERVLRHHATQRRRTTRMAAKTLVLLCLAVLASAVSVPSAQEVLAAGHQSEPSSAILRRVTADPERGWDTRALLQAAEVGGRRFVSLKWLL